MPPKAKSRTADWIRNPLTEIFGLDRRVALTTVAFTLIATGFAFFWFFHTAPKTVITIASGPQDSGFQKNAEKYAAVLARSGVKATVLTTEGSIDNLKRLSDPALGVDVAIVQGGVADESQSAKLVSLGTVNHQPLMIFYRDKRAISVLSQLEGKRIAVGPEGSGTRTLALALLAGNGIKPGGATALDDLDAEDAGKALLAGKLDAVFLMGDSAPVELIRELLHDQAIRLYSFTQADAYTRKFTYLNKLVLPRGGIDFGLDIPSSDVDLVGPSVELVSRPDLDPALCDLLIEAAREVNGGAGIFKHQGEFPSSQEHGFRLSAAATRFYGSGKSFFYRFLPFWVASLVDRIFVSLVPLLVILIPGLRAIPAMLRWRINVLIYRWYRLLLKVEQDAQAGLTLEKREECLHQLNIIEEEVNQMKVPVTFATQFYELRGHINFVRAQLTASAPAPH